LAGKNVLPIGGLEPEAVLAPLVLIYLECPSHAALLGGSSWPTGKLIEMPYSTLSKAQRLTFRLSPPGQRIHSVSGHPDIPVTIGAPVTPVSRGSTHPMLQLPALSRPGPSRRLSLRQIMEWL